MTSPPRSSSSDAPRRETGSTTRSAGEIYQPIVSYSAAVASIAAALVGARLLDIYLVAAPVSLFLCAILFAAWFGGVGPGVFSMVLSSLAFKYYFVTPIHSLAVNLQEVPRLILF